MGSEFDVFDIARKHVIGKGKLISISFLHRVPNNKRPISGLKEFLGLTQLCTLFKRLNEQRTCPHKWLHQFSFPNQSTAYTRSSTSCTGSAPHISLRKDLSLYCSMVLFDIPIR